MSAEAPGSLAPDGPDGMGRELAEGPGAVWATLVALERAMPAIGSARRAATRVVVVGTGASMEMVRVVVPGWRSVARAAGDARPIIMREASAVVFGSDGHELAPDDLVVVVSYRGTSPETVAAAKLARQAGGFVVGVTHDPASALATAASQVVGLRCGAEETGAATKSGLATLAVLQAIGGSLPNDAATRSALRTRLQRTVDDQAAVSALAPHLARADQVWLVGFGADHGLARAGHLLWHEKVCRIATALTPSELRHGPMEATRPDDAVIVLDTTASIASQTGYMELLGAELAQLGCRVAWIGRSVPPALDGIPVEALGPAALLEVLIRVQQLTRAVAHAKGTYSESMRVMRTIVRPSPPLA